MKRTDIVQMRLPKSISPCPLREAVAEVRFQPAVPDDAVFGMAYQSIRVEFPKAEALPITLLPSEVRSEQNLLIQPHFRLVNDRSVVMIGPRSMSVGMNQAYPGWSVHSERVKKILLQLYQTGIVSKVTRIGLRYISFFPFDIFPKLRMTVDVNGESLEGEETFFKTVIRQAEFGTQLQVGKGFALANKPSEMGSVIDIDSFLMEINSDLGPALESFLEQAHTIEKEMFFKLLKPEFLETLNPIYDNEK